MKLSHKIIIVVLVASFVFFVPIIAKFSMDLEGFKTKEEIEKCREKVRNSAPPCSGFFNNKKKTYAKCSERQQKKHDKIVNTVADNTCRKGFINMYVEPKMQKWLRKNLRNAKKQMMDFGQTMLAIEYLSGNQEVMEKMNKEMEKDILGYNAIQNDIDEGDDLGGGVSKPNEKDNKDNEDNEDKDEEDDESLW